MQRFKSAGLRARNSYSSHAAVYNTFNVQRQSGFRPTRTECYALRRWTRGGQQPQRPDNSRGADTSRSSHGNVTEPLATVAVATTSKYACGTKFRISSSHSAHDRQSWRLDPANSNNARRSSTKNDGRCSRQRQVVDLVGLSARDGGGEVGGRLSLSQRYSAAAAVRDR